MDADSALQNASSNARECAFVDFASDESNASAAPDDAHQFANTFAA